LRRSRSKKIRVGRYLGIGIDFGLRRSGGISNIYLPKNFGGVFPQ
jgi:hypothetical protein